MNLNIDMNNFDLTIKNPLNNNDFVNLQFIKDIIYTFMAYYNRDITHYLRFPGDNALVLPFDIIWVSLELIIFGNSPGRIGIVTDINGDIRHHKINYTNNYAILNMNENINILNGFNIIF